MVFEAESQELINNWTLNYHRSQTYSDFGLWFHKEIRTKVDTYDGLIAIVFMTFGLYDSSYSFFVVWNFVI